MALQPNQRLGPYEILAAIGSGGMGEVYRARDTRLDRIVAIKILPDDCAVRPESRERFEREARTVASLNHPHICTLHDIGHHDGTDFLVMEYLEGETLAERLKKGQLPLTQVLQYAIEISDALDKAHRKGITHRDLKPGNIMLTKSGAKLLDFGLAKLRRPQAAVANLSSLPTEGSAGNLTSQLYIRPMDGLEAHPIPGTGGGGDPFFSPDGQWLGFATFGKLMKVSLSGGTPVSLGTLNFVGFSGVSWGSQGRIAVVPQAGSPIQQIPDIGGNPQPLTRLEKGEASHRWPEFLPDGKGVLFTAAAGTATKIAVQSLGSGEHRDLVAGGDFPRYALSGHLVYLQGANLMAVPFDAQRLAIVGAAVPVIEGVRVANGVAQYSFSSTGTLVYVPSSAQAVGLKLVWVDRKGIEQPVNAPPHNYVLPKVSPDGKRVAAGIEEADNQIWVYDLGRDTLTRLTFEGNSNIDPLWTPDGKRIVFKGKGNRLFWQPADGSAGAEALTSSELAANNVPASWTPDGQVLAFMEINPNSGYDLYTLPLKDRKPQPFLRTPSLETAPRFSPDGRFIVYASDESGRIEIYVRPYPGPGGKWQISTEGGSEPVWNPNGRELFYRSGNKMIAVDVATQPTFSAGKPRTLFEGTYVPSPRSFPNYDVSSDGQRFLMLKRSEEAQAPAQINVVLNWFEELKQKVPNGKK